MWDPEGRESRVWRMDTELGRERLMLVGYSALKHWDLMEVGGVPDGCLLPAPLCFYLLCRTKRQL